MTCKRTPIIIIGAGLSGLTVASSLNNDFIVLEARDRIGGRVWSRDCGSCTLDMGAAWIHGSIGNPLNQYLKYDEMIPVAESNPWIHTGKAPILYDGVSNETRQQMIIDWNRSVKENIIADAKFGSFIYLLEVWFGTSVSSMPPSFFRNMEYNDSLFGDYAGPHYLFKNGAKSLITSIVKGSKQDLNDKISFEQIVTDILYDRDDGLIAVKTARGDSYLCEKLIITTPPGPLQNINFIPPLSASRKLALSKVKMSSYKKVQIEFDHVFWDTDNAMILTNDNAGKNDGIIPYILWNNYACIKEAPILEAICTAWQLTGKSDEIIMNAVLEHLSGMYPRMPNPISCHISRWEEDIFSQGAYSFHIEADIDDLCNPIEDRIFFAGEYTDPVYFGSLHAAYNSGLRVLQEIGVNKGKL